MTTRDEIVKVLEACADALDGLWDDLLEFTPAGHEAWDQHGAPVIGVARDLLSHLSNTAEVEQEPVGYASPEVLACIPHGAGELVYISRTAVDPDEVPLYAAPPPPVQQGEERLREAARDVLAERRRQVEAEGWTAEHDDGHTNGALAAAAACYLVHGQSWEDQVTGSVPLSLRWPWNIQWWKPTNRRHDLVKAGALILAEIERLDRALLPKQEEGRRP